MYLLLSLYLFMMSLLLFIISIMFLMMNTKFLINWLLMNISSIKIEMILFFDWMSLMFMSVVMLISSMVLIYSMDYMNDNTNFNRFMNLIIIFFSSMMFMILSPNMFSILLGWDGLGLSSYCLIIFYQNKKSLNCGMTTLLMNRIGDINILIMISLLINKNSMNFMFLNKLNYYLMIFIFMTALTKSAQMPFTIWLPMAMAAPTPVSSLVHSSTLVTAGIYLMIRFNYLFNKLMLLLMMMISLWTMILASSSALFEYDFKKIIALSTLSQLAIMMLTISINLNEMSFFHLISHAMFKSLLFLCSGIIIHTNLKNQDIRKISLINMNFPSITMIFNTASLSLCGLPFLSGFYSKDLIIEMYSMNNMNFYISNIMYMCMMMTIMYSFRLMFYISIKPLKTNLTYMFNMNNYMNYSIYLLFFLSIIYGSMINWLLFNSLNMTMLNLNKKILIFNLMIISLMIIMLFNLIKMFKIKKLIYLMYYFNNMWLFNNLLKKNKINMYNFNNNLIYIIESFWLEYLTFKKLLFMYMNISKMNIKFNIYMILMISIYFMMIIYMLI